VEIIKFEIPLTLELDPGISRKLLSGRIMEIGVARMGEGMKVASNSLNLSFIQAFSSSVLEIENSNASLVTL
jgi:hypothetical protein